MIRYARWLELDHEGEAMLLRIIRAMDLGFKDWMQSEHDRTTRNAKAAKAPNGEASSSRARARGKAKA